MREIKFRAKRIDTGTWVYGSLIQDSDRCEIRTKFNGEDLPGYNDVDPDTVGQYTGLKDRDGKEIYEGDIVKDKYENRYSVRYDEKRMSWIAHSTIPFENNIPLCVVTECTIIGNIHDNPGLLEE